MTDDANQHMILKILSGLQLGAEVSLPPGEYALGSGAEDDIHFIDVSVNPAHARLRLGANRIDIRAESGALTLPDGEKLAAGDDWREIQPLDTIAAGATRFAVALPTAQWATITEAGEPPSENGARVAEPETTAGHRYDFGQLLRKTPESARPFLIPGATALGLLLFAFWFAMTGRAILARDDHAQDLARLRAALDQFPFGKTIDARQETDGAINVSGFVDTPVERRALAGAMEKSGVEANLRVHIRELLRNELDALIRESHVKVNYTLSPEGEVTLSGVVLSPSAAENFVARVRDGVPGVKSVVSQIRTADTLLEEVRRLAHLSQIDYRVIFHLKDDMVEANGVVPSGRIDAWVGFLQAFSRQFGKDISLRSYVQLHQEGGAGAARLPGVASPILLGGEAGEAVMEKLRRGEFALGDVFAGAVAASGAPGGGGKGGGGGSPTPGADGASSPASDGSPASEGALAATGGPGAPGAPGAGGATAANIAAPATIATAANSEQAQTSGQSATPNGARPGGGAGQPGIGAGRNALGPVLSGAASPLLPGLSGEDLKGHCRRGSALTATQVADALASLDEMSLSGDAALSSLDLDRQRALLEVALNPALVRRCLKQLAEGARIVSESPYLAETLRNPDYVQVVVRNLPTYDLRISGVSLEGWRYAITKDGSKFYEGASPDAGSRIEIVGELGLAVRKGDGFSRLLYGRDINWISRR